MLNYHACFTHGTVDQMLSIRKPQCRTQGRASMQENLKATFSFAFALSQMAMTVKTASPKEPQVENPKYAMRTWLLRLGFIGDEFATAIELLTKNLDGDTAFRHGRTAA